MVRKNILFVIHAEFEQPGIIESWAREKGFSYQFWRPFAGEVLQEVPEFDWLILMGGPQSPLEMDLSPYLRSEIDLITRALAADKTILGFCLGAQLIGESLGATTEKSPHKEVGLFPIQLTKEGIVDPILAGLPHKFLVVHWHNDMPGLTEKSKVLAKSEGCPRQIVRYAPKIYGFQCHPEPVRENMEMMIRHAESDLSPGRYIQAKETILQHDFSEMNHIMISILDNLLLEDILSEERETFVIQDITVCPLVDTSGREVFILSGEKKGSGPGLHFHRIMHETFYSMAGDFQLQIDDQIIHLKAGESCTAVRSIPHQWQSMTDGPWKLLVTCTPSGNQLGYLRALATQSKKEGDWWSVAGSISHLYDLEIVPVT